VCGSVRQCRPGLCCGAEELAGTATERSDFGKAVSRILSARRSAIPTKNAGTAKHRGENHLSQQPIPGTCFALRNVERAAPGFPIWPCTRWGFPCPPAHAGSGGLLPHLFTLTTARASTGRAVCFLWHYPSECLTAPLPACIPESLLAVTRHRALWCSDFPPSPSCPGESDSPPSQNRNDYNAGSAKLQSRRGSGMNAALQRLLGHCKIHVVAVIKNTATICAGDQFLLSLAGDNDLGW